MHFNSASHQWEQSRNPANPEIPTRDHEYDRDGYRRFTWSDGSVHMVDEDFVLPGNAAVQTWWTLWYDGVPANKIKSYDNLCGRDIKLKSYNLSKIKKVMNEITKKAIALGLVLNVNALKSMKSLDRTTVFHTAFAALYREKLGDRTHDETFLHSERIGEISTITFYETLKAYNTKNGIEKATKRRKLVQQVAVDEPVGV